MDKDKSILEKIADTVKDVAKTASDAASYALKADEPGLKADERAVAYMPLAGDGLVSDPLMVPPVAAARPRRKKRAAPKRAAKKAARKTAAKKAAKKSTGKTGSKAAKKSIAKKSKKMTAKEAHKEEDAPVRRTSASVSAGLAFRRNTRSSSLGARSREPLAIALNALRPTRREGPYTAAVVWGTRRWLWQKGPLVVMGPCMRRGDEGICHPIRVRNSRISVY